MEKIVITIVRITLNGLSLIPLFLFFFFEFKYSSSHNTQTNLKRLLVISCILHAASFCFPAIITDYSESSWTCLIESFLNNFSIYMTIFTGSALLLIALINFSNPTFTEEHNVLLSFISTFFIVVISAGLCVILTLIGEVGTDKSFFCWYSDEMVIRIDFIIKIFILVIVVWLVILLELKLRNMYSELISRDETFREKIKSFKKYNFFILLVVILIIFHFTSLFNLQSQILFFIEDIIEIIIFPLIAIVFCLNSQKKDILKQCFKCKKELVVPIDFISFSSHSLDNPSSEDRRLIIHI